MNKLKTKTLVKIAREIERETKSTLPGTVSQVWDMLNAAAGHCRTVAEARREIGKLYLLE